MVATHVGNHGRASHALAPQSLQCELHTSLLYFDSKYDMLRLTPLTDVFFVMVYHSKLPSLGLSGTLAYNMNTMESLVEL